MTRPAQLPILIVLFCALMVRSLVPSGWMPAAGQGAFAIELCPGADATTMVGMDDGQKERGQNDLISRSGDRPGAHHHNNHKDQHGDCSFSPMQAGFAQLQQAHGLIRALAIAETPSLWSSSPALATGPPQLLPPARGPPTIA